MKNYRAWLIISTFYLVILGGGWLLGQWLPNLIDLNITPSSEPMIHNAIMTMMVVFILASAIPFVPGAEIGFGFIMLFGGKIAVLVYAGMVFALLLAFLVGRLVPLSFVAQITQFIGLKRANKFIMKLATLNSEQRMALLTGKDSSRYSPFLLRHRYLILALTLNLPGNSLIGGGGGIAFIAGVSRMFSYGGYIMAICIAVLPVPAFFYLTR
ncbi:MAG: hypothetical protein HRU29_08150 [Rhizobiales bacterium]|nr:hypothetical protein [Hyphomicrobiales bacterium]NRB14357.1 hypothetical protein [Hyphomicrobiales bacterium]